MPEHCSIMNTHTHTHAGPRAWVGRNAWSKLGVGSVCVGMGKEGWGGHQSERAPADITETDAYG